MIKRITGKTNWYDAPAANLEDLSGLIEDFNSLDGTVDTLVSNLSTHENSSNPHILINTDTNTQYYLKMDNSGPYLEEV